MPYRIKTASSIFQRAMENILNGEVENMIIYQGDICIGASSKKELDKKMEHVLNKLKKASMSINCNKCKFNCNVINYFGFQIAKQGISPDPYLLKKIEQTEKN